MPVLIHISAVQATGERNPTGRGRPRIRLIRTHTGRYNQRMIRRFPTRIALALLVASAVLLAVSCATSKGSTLGRVIAAEGGSSSRQKPSGSPPEEPSQNPPETTRGLQVLTDPSGVEVWIDGAFMGLSPYVFEDISVGWHQVVLRKTGYYEASGWVQFKGDAMLYQTSLTQITGFLQISATPQDITILIDGQDFPAGTLKLGVGTHNVVVKSFGYTPYEGSVVISENAITPLSVSLPPAPFEVISFSTPKSSVNPANPGLLGTMEANFSVTGPGTGDIRVFDSAGAEVYLRSLAPFTTWDHAFTWDLHTSTGRMLSDGIYTMRITGRGPDAEAPVTREIQITVDSTLKVAARSVWSGSAGLLYAPVAEVLPNGDYQVGVLAAGISASDGSGFQAPFQLGARIGLGGGMEVDASGGIMATANTLPILGSVAFRWNLLTPRGGYGTGAAVQAKLAVQLVPTQESAEPLMTDTFANFTGLSVELPLQLSLGAVSGLLSVGVTGSFWYPYLYSTGTNPQQGAVAWMYLRAGVMLEVGSVTAGISASTRTQQLPGGIAFLGSPIPFEAGAEVHWLIPNTRILVSGLFAGEYQDSQNYYFMGGAGLGFLY